LFIREPSFVSGFVILRRDKPLRRGEFWGFAIEYRLLMIDYYELRI